jgi:hypothetical protein
MINANHRNNIHRDNALNFRRTIKIAGDDLSGVMLEILEAKILEEEALAKNQDREVTAQLERVQDDFPNTYLDEGNWDCSDSPTGICWYSSHDDPCWDSCVYCEEPEERK